MTTERNLIEELFWLLKEMGWGVCVDPEHPEGEPFNGFVVGNLPYLEMYDGTIWHEEEGEHGPIQ